MCLERIIGKPKKKSGIGYKVFRVDNDKLYGEFFKPDKPRPVNQWLRSKDYCKERSIARGSFFSPFFCPYPVYTPGFHIFKTKKGIWSWCYQHSSGIRKVLYRKATCVGIQNNHHVIIAKEIKILE